MTAGVGLATYQSAAAVTLYSITNLGTLGGEVSGAYGINDKGQVVGQSSITNGEPRAFVWSEGIGMRNLGVLDNGYNCAALNINNIGQVVGSSYINSGVSRAFLWTESTPIRDLGTPSIGSEAWGINDAGQVVGDLFDPTNGQSRAFLWTESGGTQNLGTLGGNIRSAAFDINNAGQVVGFANTANEQTRAFLWTESKGLKNLGTLGYYSFATGINDVGQVVGDSDSTDVPTRAFLWSESTGMINLGTLGADNSYSYSYAINNAGQVVGNSIFNISNAGATQHAFVWEKGTMFDLNNLLSPDSGWTVFEARGINNVGQIVGTGSLDGKVRAVLLSPIPNSKPIPESNSVLGTLAFAALGVAHCKHKHLKLQSRQN
ncbi:DUF3466 family protein [Nostoc sp. UHCC 0302]|uniref:DUF3466 family protein n=1 Tax=Nostoc sp. UHCC 0302 TaxID=3134896 RepID=UPI00311CAAFF